MKLRLLPALLLASSTLIAAPAFAQDLDSECTVDADCPMDYSCQEIGAYACASPPPCLEGDVECEMERANEPDCESGVIMGCVAPPPEQCDPSADESACGAGLTCLTYTYEQCSGGGYDGGPVTCTVDPDGNEECGAPTPGEPIEEPSCTTESESYCVPDYFAPCQVDADCGGGFSCVDEPDDCYSVCSAGGGTDISCAEGEECPTEPAPDCMEVCEDASGDKYCELQQVECTSDADCAGDLTCQQIESYESQPPVLCGGGAPDEPGMGGSDMGDDEPDCGEPEPVVPVTQNYCLPVGWERWVGADGPQGGGADYDEAVAEVTGREGDDNGSGDWKLIDKQAPEAPQQDGGEASGEEADGGCQSAKGGSPAGGLGLLAALGMMLGLRRRKQ